MRFLLLANQLCAWVEKKCNFKVQKYDIMMISVDYYSSCPLYWLIFSYPDPDQGCQNEPDSDPHHWSKVDIGRRKIYNIFVILVELWIIFWLIFLLTGSVSWKGSRSRWPKWNGSETARFLKFIFTVAEVSLMI